MKLCIRELKVWRQGRSGVFSKKKRGWFDLDLPFIYAPRVFLIRSVYF